MAYLITLQLRLQLEDLSSTLAQIEAAGGGGNAPTQIRRDVSRLREDLQGVDSAIFHAAALRAEGEIEEAARVFKVDVLNALFTGYPPGTVFDYEGGPAQPPKRGIVWQLASLINQVWAGWHPVLWIRDDGLPWWQWVPEAWASGMVAGVNELEAAITTRPEAGPGWGARAGEAIEALNNATGEFVEDAAGTIRSFLSTGSKVVLVGLAALGAYFLFVRKK